MVEGRETVHFWLVDKDGKVVSTLTEHGHHMQVACPLPIIARALSVNATPYLYMAHNHPAGDPRPSHADIDTTRRIWRLARAVGASLQDHVILGRTRSFSFRENGLL
jgi:DNA repair protein RadC